VGREKIVERKSERGEKRTRGGRRGKPEWKTEKTGGVETKQPEATSDHSFKKRTQEKTMGTVKAEERLENKKLLEKSDRQGAQEKKRTETRLNVPQTRLTKKWGAGEVVWGSSKGQVRDG